MAKEGVIGNTILNNNPSLEQILVGLLAGEGTGTETETETERMSGEVLSKKKREGRKFESSSINWYSTINIKFFQRNKSLDIIHQLLKIKRYNPNFT